MPIIHPGLEEVGLKVEPIGYILCIIMVSLIYERSQHAIDSLVILAVFTINYGSQ